MNVVQEIATWAKTLPPWQSDAIRRIFTQESLSADDETAVLAMLRHGHGLTSAEDIVAEPVPFSVAMDSPAGSCQSVVLKELHSVEHVNALVPGQSIKFALEGMTVIFGENGAGKSGYARVFKHACHAREKGDPILTNVVKPTKLAPTAVIELSVDDDQLALRWKAGSPASAVLSEIAVFDSHCARVFVDNANEVVYIPYGLDVFSRLGTLFVKLKARITAETKAIAPTYLNAVDYGMATVVGRFVRNINAQTAEEQVDAFGLLDPLQLERLAQLRAFVAAAKANPPKQRALQLRRMKKRFEQLQAAIATVMEGLNAAALARICELHATTLTARKSAALASTDVFANEPLSGTGSDPWRSLFESARRFSEQHAYADEVFPVTRDGALCVLCQQTLEAPANDRLKRFQEFIVNDSAVLRDKAEKALAAATADLSKLDTGYLEKDGTLVEELKSYHEQLAQTVLLFFEQATALRSGMLLSLAKDEAMVPPSSPEFLLSDVESVTVRLEAQATECDLAEKPEELAKLVAELAELEDRERIQKHAKDVKAYIRDKKREAGLKKCEKALDTNGITRQGNELMDRVITEQLIENLDRELGFFDVQCAKVQVKKLGDKGKTKHQLTLPNTAKPSGVLSEGEQRIVAISSFLAELATSSSDNPIIFDDPVSSLDHRFRERVAARLVREAKQRQVVVFTHDVVMLLALEREAADQQVPQIIQTVSKSVQGPGECIPRPWYACDTKERIGMLKTALAQFPKLQKADPGRYSVCVQEFYGRLREAWERAIEEILLQGVVMRFRPSVETMRLKKVAIVPEDYVLIDDGMSRCSAFLTGHDTAAAIASPMPSPEEAAADLTKLDDFVKRLREREKKTEATVKELLKPPAAVLSDTRAATVLDLSAA
jgi:energy-coupling factor transporter ATP-binding protein EcfA2